MTPKRYHERHPDDEPEFIVSNTEQTGLIPALPEDEDESEAYEELYPIHRQRENVRSRR